MFRNIFFTIFNVLKTINNSYTCFMTNFEVIVIGELNIDLLLNKIEKIPSVGTEIIAEQMDMVLGSSSAIFASNLSALGANVGFMGKVGKDDFGEFVLKELTNKRVNTSLIKRDEQHGTGITVVMNYDEDRAMVTYPGAMANLTLSDIQYEHIIGAKHLHFSSYFLQPGINKDLKQIFKKVKEMGLTVSFDTQWDPDEKWEIKLDEILPYVDVFLPNETELKYLTNTNSLDEAIRRLASVANVIAIKAGNEGSYLYHNGQLNHIGPFLNDKVIDAIGAGDSFNAGFIYKFLSGADIIACQNFGNLTGAVSTTEAGGTAAFKSYENFVNVAKNQFGVIV